jgi:ubiquinone biosynthesis protein
MRNLLLDLRRTATLLRVLVVSILAPAWWDRLRRRPERGQGGDRLRRSFEELGLTYLKLGQYLAMRDDVIPTGVAQELRRLLERVRPVPFPEIRAAIEAAIGGPVESAFRAISETPIASASVAQVHEAYLLDGQRVALKVQRPGIERLFMADVRILRRLAGIADALGLLSPLSASDMVEQFVAWTLPELDFLIEGTTADRLRENALAYERVPRVYWDHTTRRLLTLELIEGLSLAELSRIFQERGEDGLKRHLPNLDLRLVIHRLAFASMRQMYVTGFFHGDPHPGNVLILDDNTIAFVDFGIFGDLSAYERLILRRHVEAMAMGRIQESLHYYVKQLIATPETDERAFRAEALHVFRKWYLSFAENAVTAPSERRLGGFANEMVEIIRKYKLQMGWSSLLFWRALSTLDSTAAQFPGYFNLLDTMREFFEPSPTEIVDRVADVLHDPERLLELGSLTIDPSRQAQVLVTLAEQRAWQAEIEETPEASRVENSRARSLACACVGLSLVIVGLAPPFEGDLRALAFALAAPLAIWSIAGLRFR